MSNHPPPDPQSERWSTEAFQFVNRPTPFVFIHCKVKVCNATDPTSRCAQGCQASRKRRQVKPLPETPDDVYPLAQGPFALHREKRESEDISLKSDLSMRVKRRGKYSVEPHLFENFVYNHATHLHVMRKNILK